MRNLLKSMMKWTFNFSASCGLCNDLKLSFFTFLAYTGVLAHSLLQFLFADLLEFACLTGRRCWRKCHNCLDRLHLEAFALLTSLYEYCLNWIIFFSAFQKDFWQFAILHPRYLGLEPTLVLSQVLSSSVYVVLTQLGMQCQLNSWNLNLNRWKSKFPKRPFLTSSVLGSLNFKWDYLSLQ